MGLSQKGPHPVPSMAELEQRCRHAEVHLMRALKSKADEDIVKAIDLYLEILSHNPPLADPYIGTAYLVFSSGQREKALKILNIPLDMGVVDLRLEKMKLRMKKLMKKPAAPTGKVKKLTHSLRQVPIETWSGTRPADNTHEFQIINF